MNQLKNTKVVKGVRVPHVCATTLDGDLRSGFPFNVMLAEHSGDFPKHGHEYSELNIVLAGSANHITDYEQYKIETGDVFVINGDHQHGFENCHELQVAIIQYDEDVLGPFLEQLNLLMGFHGLFHIETKSPTGMTYRQRFTLKSDQLESLKILFQQMHNEFDLQSPAYKLIVQSLFLQMVTGLSRYYQESKVGDERFAVSMANVTSHICQNFREQIKIEELAEIAGLSVSQLQRRFKLIYDTTPIKMIQELRAEEASNLLQNTDYELNEIAEILGYKSASFFSTQYKQLRGQTPRDYRKTTIAKLSSISLILISFILSILMLTIDLSSAEKPSEIDLLFLRKIKPLLKEKCHGCHGGNKDKIKGKYTMLKRENMLKGGESKKAAIVPGSAGKSPLMILIKRHDEEEAMPPKEADKLSAAQVGWIEDWINAGAPWPDDKILVNDKEYVKVEISGALSKDWAERRYHISDIWSFLPVKKSSPAMREYQHPIDNFIGDKLKDKSLKIASKAEKKVIIRRVYLDLTGLNPSYAEIKAFVNDKSVDALDKLINKLLASNHYGEQAARYWLDVVRYADTSGYANDFERPHAWRYRDYVIRSFNQDKAYNQFILEQIAGDEMDEKNPEYLIATGFMRMGAWEHTGMSVPEVTRQLFLDDVTETVGKTFLAQPVGCAKCHDHKFDPIPTKDYYRIQAVFANTQFANRKLAIQKYENLGLMKQEMKLSNERIALLEESKKLAADEDKESIKPILGKQKNYFQREIHRYYPMVFSVYNGNVIKYSTQNLYHPMKRNAKDKPSPTMILTGGSLGSPGEQVTPGVLSAVYGSNDRISPNDFNKIPNALNGRRLAFAKWIANEKNTLTARVIVNRIWQQHFNRGIVVTPNSFGKMGAKPTHPELLDFLANWFVNNGWSIKKLHKFIMTSNAYQMSNNHKELVKLKTIDPDNKLLAYYPARRMQAEMITDSLLKMTGELNTEMGGPGIFPEINWEVAMQNRLIMGTLAPVYQPSVKKSQRHRRQIYAFVRRSISDPLLEVFNKPGSELSCARRDETTITPQAFSLFNSEFIHNRALALANKIYLKTNKSNAALNMDERITQAYQTVYGRSPSKTELKQGLDHLSKMTAYHQTHKIKEIPLPLFFKAEILAEKTGQPLVWRQQLNNLKNYERDLMPWQVNDDVLGLYELCLVLINSNEFLYFY